MEHGLPAGGKNGNRNVEHWVTAAAFYMEIVTGSGCGEHLGEAGHDCRQAQLPPACGVGSSQVVLEAALQRLGGLGWDVQAGPDSDPSPWWGLAPLGLSALGSGTLSCPNPSRVPEEVPGSSLEVACDPGGESGWQGLLKSQGLVLKSQPVPKWMPAPQGTLS